MINHIDFFFIILFSFNVIVQTDERTDGRVVCKIVFSITFNVRFGAQKDRLIVKTLLSTKNVYLKI